MLLTIKQQVKNLSKADYKTLCTLCHAAKSLTNEAIYAVRQHYFNEKKFLRFESVYHLLKQSPNYKTLNSNMSQQIMREVDASFRSFFALLRKKNAGTYSGKVRIPHYLPKDGYTTLVISMVNIKGGKLVVPYSNSFKKQHDPVVIKIPPILQGKKVVEVRIIPRYDARFFEIQYVYDVPEDQRNLDPTKALALDFGINNLVTAASSCGDTFIIDGRRLKAINQWYNKYNARLQSIKDKQGQKGITNRQAKIARSRNNQVNDYLSKAARQIINYCLEHTIGTLVIGYDEEFQRNSNMGRVTNQNFVNIPFGKLANKLEYLCQLYGICFVKQEESYTSKASFWDKDEIPAYDKDNPNSQHFSFSGRRIKRGMYRCSDGVTLNADVNGALNILRKSNVVCLDALYARGVVDTPVRIRVA